MAVSNNKLKSGNLKQKLSIYPLREQAERKGGLDRRKISKKAKIRHKRIKAESMKQRQNQIH